MKKKIVLFERHGVRTSSVAEAHLSYRVRSKRAIYRTLHDGGPSVIYSSVKTCYLPYITRRYAYITPPWGSFLSLIAGQPLLDSQEGANTERYVFGSSRRDVFNADLFGTGSIPTVEISSMENRPRGVAVIPGIHQSLYTVHAAKVRWVRENSPSRHEQLM